MSESEQVAPAPRGAELIPIEGEPGWAHVWATTPDGVFQAVADFHLVCQRAKAFTQRQSDGSMRHVCRACFIEEALAGRGE